MKRRREEATGCEKRKRVSFGQDEEANDEEEETNAKVTEARLQRQQARQAKDEDDVPVSAVCEPLGGDDNPTPNVKRDAYNEFMGGEMTSFNLKELEEEGKFDASGNFENKVKRDAWLYELDEVREKEQMEGVSVSESRALASLAGKQIRKEKEEIDPDATKLDALRTIEAAMEPDETVKQAIRRLSGPTASEAARKNRAKMRKDKAEAEAAEPQEKTLPDPRLDKLTQAAARLVAMGEFTIHNMTKRQVEALIQDEHEEVAKDKRWELKWDGKEEVHGPFTWEHIEAWKTAGCLALASVRLVHDNPQAEAEPWQQGSDVAL
ncbi:LIN1-like protein [Diplonema papillatum]|nr:LIN1-like protein [Diplonema papillatum]